MAIDYWAVEQALVDILQDAPELDSVTVRAEQAPFDVAASLPCVSVFLTARDSQAGQPMAAGTRWNMHLVFSLWCYVVVVDNIESAARVRDSLMASVESVIMRNRTIADTANTSWVAGGRFNTYPLESGGFFVGGEIRLVADYTGIV